MRRMRIPVAALILVIGVLAARAEAAPTMAFGYLVNRSKDANYDYLETLFPNSFANALRNIFYVTIVKPGQIDRELARDGLSLEKQYKPHELMELTERISADYFIYGSFDILPNDRIRIELNLYGRGLNRIFSFSNVGAMEKEIFKLVDRITLIMVDFLGKNNFYLSRIVPRGSKLGILTNLEGADLNYLYSAFLTGGYGVASMQVNYLDNSLTTAMIESFKCIEATETSYRRVSNPQAVRFLHGTWTGDRYYEEINYTREAYRIYDAGYTAAKSAALNRLVARHGIDMVMVIGFNDSRTRAWVRCLDIKNNDLIWMQSNIKGGVPGDMLRDTCPHEHRADPEIGPGGYWWLTNKKPGRTYGTEAAFPPAGNRIF